MNKIAVDYNRKDSEGRILTRVNHGDLVLKIGDIVECYQPGEPDMDFEGTVEEITMDGKVKLRMNWA